MKRVMRFSQLAYPKINPNQVCKQKYFLLCVIVMHWYLFN